MARAKNKRNLNFKPKIKSFVPENIEVQGITNLLHEEIEAIYLMDTLNLYQEDAANSMEVSRTTFTRILKSGRQKLANAIINGYKIVIEDEKDDFIIAICLKDKNDFSDISVGMNFIIFYKIQDKNITFVSKIENPVLNEINKPAIVLPKLLLENKVNFFISSKIGEGLKNSLLSKGIQPIVRNSIELNDISSIC